MASSAAVLRASRAAWITQCNEDRSLCSNTNVLIGATSAVAGDSTADCGSAEVVQGFEVMACGGGGGSAAALGLTIGLDAGLMGGVEVTGGRMVRPLNGYDCWVPLCNVILEVVVILAVLLA